MKDMTFVVAGVPYTFKMRYIRDKYVPCANIKAHTVYDVKLDRARQRKLLVLEKRHWVSQDRLESWAWESTAEWFWGHATAEARARGLGEATSDGRQGGWLVLTRWDVEALETRLEEMERSCKHCRMAYPEHVEGKCVFLSTRFSTGEFSIDIFEEIKTYLSAMVSVVNDDCPEEYLCQLEHYVDDQWDAYKTHRDNLAEIRRINARRAAAADAGAGEGDSEEDGGAAGEEVVDDGDDPLRIDARVGGEGQEGAVA